MTDGLRRAAIMVVSLVLVGLVGACSGSAAKEAKNQPEASSSTTATASATPAAQAAVPTTTAAVPPAEPSATPAPVAAAGVVVLEGTSWTGTDSDGDAYVYRFGPGGRFGYTSPNGTFGASNDTWTQEGDQVTMKTAGGYATYTGTVGADSISGNASNQPGHTWTWSAQRQ